MMKYKFLFLLTLFFFFIDCSEEAEEMPEPMQDCSTSNLQLVVVDSMTTICGDNAGTITLGAQGANGAVEYSIDGFTYQSSPVFTGLTSGVYRVKIRDAAGCEAEDQVLLFSGISLENDVKPILNASCAITGCHVPAAQSPNFTITSGIQAAASNIKRHMEDNTMPPVNSGLDRIPEIDRQILICWVNDGAMDN